MFVGGPKHLPIRYKLTYDPRTGVTELSVRGVAVEVVITLTRCSSQSYKTTMKVGARELKNRLGHYLRQVKAGETVHVTDRGKIVAELRPSAPAKTGDEEALRRLAADGVVTLGAGHHEDFRPYPVTRGKKLTSRRIIEDRQ